MSSKITWPHGKKFAFSVFDDADAHTNSDVQDVYRFLKDLGIRTTKSVWPNKGTGTPICGGFTCEDPGYLDWIHQLESEGFEIGYHLATYHSSTREESRLALDKYRKWFGHDPVTMANHALCKDTIYWGPARLSNPVYKSFYKLLNIHKDKNFLGHEENSDYFWGDLCKERIKYVRNFTFRGTNTLKECPFMPYIDPAKEYVNMWYASTEGPKVGPFSRATVPDKIDQVEEEGGLCLMYTHFGYQFSVDGKINPEFRRNMEHLAAKDCWFAPVKDILDYLLKVRGEHVITSGERNALERKWLKERLILGST
jgi:hypothetical protein